MIANEKNAIQSTDGGVFPHQLILHEGHLVRSILSKMVVFFDIELLELVLTSSTLVPISSLQSSGVTKKDESIPPRKPL